MINLFLELYFEFDFRLLKSIEFNSYKSLIQLKKIKELKFYKKLCFTN
jgi:hypothetical protein